MFVFVVSLYSRQTMPPSWLFISWFLAPLSSSIASEFQKLTTHPPRRVMGTASPYDYLAHCGLLPPLGRTAPSHYLNQCWLNFNGIFWHSSEDNITRKAHDDVIQWKHFPCYWPFVRGIHRSPLNYPHKFAMSSYICPCSLLWVQKLLISSDYHIAHIGGIKTTTF